MGKFNWRAAVAGASNEIRRQSENKRAYERADEENAMAMSRLLAEQGMPIPENIMRKMGPMTRELMPQIEQAIKQGKEREMEDWLTKTELGAQITAQYRQPRAEPQKPSSIQMLETFANMSVDDIKNLPNDQRRKLFADYSASKRKEDSLKALRPRYQIIKNESTGKVTRINVDTGEETIVKPEDPALMKKAKAKEESEKKKQEQQNTIRATKLYQEWMKGDREDPQALSNVNTLLSEFGYQITPITKNVDYGFDTTNYQLGKIGTTKDPSQMTDEELAAEVERIKRGQ